MSRSGYTDDCDNIQLWRAAVDRAILGKRGQAFLKELAAAMDAMPVKRLIRSELIDAKGECCTIGVVCKAKNIDISTVDEGDAEEVGKAVNVSRAMAAEIEYMNDEQFYDKTPEQRWDAMRKWVTDQIVNENLKTAPGKEE